MTTRAALTERDRTIIAGSGVIAVALLYVGVPHFWNLTDGAAFVYPPHALLLLLPFAAMPYAAAVAIWSALNLFCLFRAAELMNPRCDIALLACLAPAALMMLASGYAGGFLALLATVVLVQGRKRPVLAGLNLALMTVQPQFALMLALTLLLIGYRRAVMFAVPWTLALLLASVISFGIQPWSGYVAATALVQPAAISLLAGARMAGLPELAAHILQWGFGFVALAGAVVVFMRRGPQPRSIALLLLVVTLALPSSGSPGLVLAAPALTLALFAESPADDRPWLPSAPALLLWLMPPLAALFGGASWPIAPLLIAGLVLYALARETIWRQRPAGDAAGADRIWTQR